VGGLRWAMVATGFGGALLVIRPSASGASAGDVWALLSGASYAFGLMATRRLAAHDPGLVTGVLSALTGIVLFSLAVPCFWQCPSPAEWGWMALIGVVAALGHFLLIAAHRMATAAQLAPYGYAEIVSTIVFGLAVFGEWPSTMVWLGILVIVASGIVVTWSNAQTTAEAEAAGSPGN
jgi:drug/metabolite transporter (DMT)-like permease